MTSPKFLWPFFILLAVVTLVATGWVSMRVIRLEQERIEKAKIAKVEENVSLALWRIDSLVAPLVAVENARPFQGFGLPLQNWQVRQSKTLELDNHYFTLELASEGETNKKEKVQTVRVLDGEVPAKLCDAKETSRLIAMLPEPTIRLSESPTLQFGSPASNKWNYSFSGKTTTSPTPSTKYSGKGKMARSKAEYERRQSTLNRAMSNINTTIQLPSFQQNQMPTMYNNAPASENAGYPFPNLPATTSPAPGQPAASQPNTPSSTPAKPQSQPSSSPATGEGAFYPPFLLPALLCQVGTSEEEPDNEQTVLVPFQPREIPAGFYSNNPNQATPVQPNPYGQQQGYSLPQQAASLTQRAYPMQAVQQIAPTLSAVEEGVWAPMEPVCLDGQLLLLRRVRFQGHSLLQGCVFDWPCLAKLLEKEVTDLLPAAHLILDDKQNAPGRMLASLPVRLEPGLLPEVELAQFHATFSPVLVSVTVAFGCVLLSIGAFAVLLHGMVRLGRRRSEFVTAVTHELRTPLTTFRMYSEMLAEGMVEETSQKSYLQTLESESDRLTHLVENVLSSARLERGRHAGRLETLPIGELITPIASRLTKRCRRAGMDLKVTISREVNGTSVRTNPSAVEQILWNLVDNACKYAAMAEDRTIRLTCEVQERTMAVTVADAGPGIPREVRRRLFCGFSKTASEAARTAPGVGLGLALSRRLARDLGGDLELMPTDRGAGFRLSLKLD